MQRYNETQGSCQIAEHKACGLRAQIVGHSRQAISLEIEGLQA